MSFKLRHQYSHRGKTMWIGVMSSDQKPKLCSRCGRPVVMAYRVHKREFDRKLGDHVVAKGQYEVAHIQDDRPVFDACPFPSLLDQLNERVQREQLEKEEKEYEVTGPNERRTIHWELPTGSDSVTRVGCGAKGSLWTTLDTATVTCYNCKARIEQGKPIQPTKEPTMSTTSQAIKDKIAAAKAKKAGQGAAANLVQKDEDGVPMPVATKTGKVSKKAVQTAKADKGPKLMNACGCGCEQPCQSRFLPGHDAKLHGWVKRIAAGKMNISELPEQVRSGMYAKVKQGSVKDSEGNVTLQGVQPSVDEATYLETLKGLGGPAPA